ncbi:DUF1028 domain-containing protein [Kineococcus sp. SYSU DK004]|uniref:DUF1028 domain-containing protein n=1 Tax=Kineococcus sp. SYSU DK004 TaxID=3383125 RepID=UPI003D7D26C9
MTCSILARDAGTGEIGVATQSQALAVGNSVPFAQVGVGVVATQSLTEPMYGRVGLDLLGSGLTVDECLQALRAVDPHPERRQVAVMAVGGEASVYTGEACVGEAGHAVGRDCIALANMAASADVWTSMRQCFEDTRGSLTERLVAALHAGEEAGGDVRGQRSAAVVVVRAHGTGRPWHDTVVDLRVDDQEDPLAELGRVVQVRARYQAAVEAFDTAVEGDVAGGDRRLRELHERGALDEPDHVLRRALVAGLAGREDEARDLIGVLRGGAPHWLEVARRFGQAGTVPGDLVERLLAERS